MHLGVLDFGLISRNKDPGAAIRETVQLAQLSEKLGFSRYWLAEHHEPYFAWASPEILAPLILQQTNRIRVGVAGFLLHFYSPLKIAEIGRVLESLYPGRFDLGVAAGLSEEITRQALSPGFDLQHSQTTRLYGKKVVELIDYLRSRFPKGHRFANGPTPIGQRSPVVWLMGTGKGKGSMFLASSQGTAYSYSLFHGDSSEGPATLEEYRQGFQASPELSESCANIALTIICAETEAAAAHQRLFIEALKIVNAVNVCGTPEQCREQLLDLRHRYGVDECILVPLWESFEDRARTFRLLSEAFALAHS